jgi:tRNA G18 (ribose-2'-O)-methylase SpoU
MTKDNKIILILHDIRSAMNVGAIIRTADGMGASKVYLTGYTATPNHPKVLKTSLGAENSVSWEYFDDIDLLLENLKKQGFQILGLEITDKSKYIWDSNIAFPVALLLGNEIRGIESDLIDRCDQIVSLPMLGEKESLNVATATGIAAYELLRMSKHQK